MDWDKKVRGLPLAGRRKGRSFFRQDEEDEKDKEDKMIFISCPVNPLNSVNPADNKGLGQTSRGRDKKVCGLPPAGRVRQRFFGDRINRIDRIIKVIFPYPLHPLNPVNPV